MKLVHLGFNPAAMMMAMAADEVQEYDPHAERRKQQRERKNKVKETTLDRRSKREAKHKQRY